MSHSLFNLVKSLSKSEKRHVKLMSKTNSKSKNLLELFDHIDAMADYDEKNLAQIKNPEVTKHLAVNKTRLYDFVLKALRSYYATKHKETVILNYFAEIQILYSKKLFSDCEKRIAKVRKISHGHDVAWLSYKLNDWEEKLIKEKGKFLKESISDLDRLHSDNKIIQEKLSVYTSLKYFNHKLLLYSKNGVTNIDHFESNSIQRLIGSTQLSKCDVPSTIQYHTVNALYNYLNNNVEEGLKSFREVNAYIEQMKDGKEEYRDTYFMSLNNVLIMGVLLKDLQLVDDTLSKIYMEYQDDLDFEAELLSLTKCYELSIYTETADIERGMSLVEVIEDLVESPFINEINRHYYYFNIALINFYQGNFSTSLQWINKLINDFTENRKHTSSNLFYYGNIFFLFIHLELGNFDFVLHQTPSIRKILLKQKPLNEAEINVFTLMKQLAEEPQKFTQLVQDHQPAMNLICAIPTNKTILQYFDVLSWMKSKTGEESFAQIIQNKYKTADTHA